MSLNLGVVLEKKVQQHKKEGDKKTPKGTFEIENLYFRKDRKEKPKTLLRCIEIKKEWVGVMMLIFQKNITSF